MLVEVGFAPSVPPPGPPSSPSTSSCSSSKEGRLRLRMRPAPLPWPLLAPALGAGVLHLSDAKRRAQEPHVVLVVCGLAVLLLTLVALVGNVDRATDWLDQVNERTVAAYHADAGNSSSIDRAPAAGPACPHPPTPPSEHATSLVQPQPATVTVYAPAPTASRQALAAAAGSECDVDSKLLQKFGRHSVRLSQAHVGSGFRVQEVLKKVGRGEKIKVAVLGGSVSEGHGFGTEPNQYGAIPYEQIWHQWVVRDLVDRFGEEAIEFVAGAKAATDSSYFEWCYPAHIGIDADLILVELAVNDDFTPEHFASSETLLRSLLSLPSQPAVLLVDSFALLNARGRPMSLNGGDAHAPLALRYDVPSVSLRAAALTAMMARPGLVGPWFHGDERHIAAPMHEMLGGMVSAYLQEEGCRLGKGGYAVEKERWGTDEEHAEWPGMSTLGQVPKNLITDPWDSSVPHPSAPPTCHLAQPGPSPATLTPLLPLPPSWSLFSWKFAKSYWQTLAASSEPIRFPVSVRPGAKGDVAVGYLRSPKYSLARARCEVEGTGQGAVLDGWWSSGASLTQAGVVATGLERGEYVVRCWTLPKAKQAKGRVALRIASVMSV